MSTADELRSRLAVAELEDALVAAKEGDSEDLADIKTNLRYTRWVARGGPAAEEARLAEDPDAGHTNPAVAGLYQRWLAERAEG